MIGDDVGATPAPSTDEDAERVARRVGEDVERLLVVVPSGRAGSSHRAPWPDLVAGPGTSGRGRSCRGGPSAADALVPSAPRRHSMRAARSHPSAGRRSHGRSRGRPPRGAGRASRRRGDRAGPPVAARRPGGRRSRAARGRTQPVIAGADSRARPGARRAGHPCSPCHPMSEPQLARRHVVTLRQTLLPRGKSRGPSSRVRTTGTRARRGPARRTGGAPTPR